MNEKEIDYVEYMLKDELMEQQEHEQREFIFTTHFKNGSAIIPNNSNFHPQMFRGTKKEYHAKLDELFGRFWENENGKVIGGDKYTLEEYDNLKLIKI